MLAQFLKNNLKIPCTLSKYGFHSKSYLKEKRKKCNITNKDSTKFVHQNYLKSWFLCTSSKFAHHTVPSISSSHFSRWKSLRIMANESNNGWNTVPNVPGTTSALDMLPEEHLGETRGVAFPFNHRQRARRFENLFNSIESLDSFSHCLSLFDLERPRNRGQIDFFRGRMWCVCVCRSGKSSLWALNQMKSDSLQAMRKTADVELIFMALLVPERPDLLQWTGMPAQQNKWVWNVDRLSSLDFSRFDPHPLAVWAALLGVIT